MLLHYEQNLCDVMQHNVSFYMCKSCLFNWYDILYGCLIFLVFRKFSIIGLRAPWKSVDHEFFLRVSLLGFDSLMASYRLGDLALLYQLFSRVKRGQDELCNAFNEYIKVKWRCRNFILPLNSCVVALWRHYLLWLIWVTLVNRGLVYVRFMPRVWAACASPLTASHLSK